MKKRKQDAKKRKQEAVADQPVAPQAGGVLLRSQMFAPPSPEQQAAIEKVLKGIGMDVRVSIAETQVCYMGGHVFWTGHFARNRGI